MVGLIEASERTHTTNALPRTVSALTLVLWVNHTAAPVPCRTPYSGLADRCGSGSCGITTAGEHKTLCVPSKSGAFIFPSSVKVLWSNPLAFKVRFSGDSCSHCWILRMGNPDMDLRNFAPVGELLWYNCSPFLWFIHLAVTGFDFIMIVSLLLSHCGFSLFPGCGDSFFGALQSLPQFSN